MFLNVDKDKQRHWRRGKTLEAIFLQVGCSPREHPKIQTEELASQYLLQKPNTSCLTLLPRPNLFRFPPPLSRTLAEDQAFTAQDFGNAFNPQGPMITHIHWPFAFSKTESCSPQICSTSIPENSFIHQDMWYQKD